MPGDDKPNGEEHATTPPLVEPKPPAEETPPPPSESEPPVPPAEETPPPKAPTPPTETGIPVAVAGDRTARRIKGALLGGLVGVVYGFFML